MQTVLALETSCDESAVAVMGINDGKIHILSDFVYSQIAEHTQWGGVVPEIASRRHLEVLPGLIEKALIGSGKQIAEIDAIASTVAPGLAGSLLIGSITGRTLSVLNDLPFFGIHHLEGHLASVLLSESPPRPPYLVLLVSGGHTELIRVDNGMKFSRLGRSHDDAVGEAFDKVARLLGLAYPGGPEIEKKAKTGDSKKFSLPQGKISKPGGGFYPYDFSFSGLKTAMLRKIEELRNENFDLPIEDLAASFENVVAEVLVARSIKCAQDQRLNSLVMVGGVAANTRLRKMMAEKALANSIKVHLAPKAFCTDNAAMIGTAALMRLVSGTTPSSLELGVTGRMPLDQADLLYQQNQPF
tara:strand:- start:3535 stop:4605 length:1071 start_codon:yes stop_codon:yes gene_type:complete